MKKVMRKKVIVGSVLTVLIIASCENKKASDLYSDAEKQEQAAAIIDPATAPVLKFESDNYDFGNLPAAAKVDHYFRFTNTGKTPLVIKDAKGSCGCTVPVFPKHPIAVGATDSIKITYDAGSQTGKQHKTVTLTTNTVKGKETWSFTATLPDAPATKENKVKELQGT